MLFDIKKLFTKGTTLGRFEYIKLALGLLLFPALLIQITVAIPPNNMTFYPVAAITIIILLAYWIIFWVATYKRITNIFEKTITSVIALLVYIFGGMVKLLHMISLVMHFIIILIKCIVQLI